MNYQQKQTLSLVLLCVVCSVAASVFTVFALLSRAEMTGAEITQTATQTVTINEKESAKININTATEQELQTLPGVGEITAKKIIENRPYTDVWEIADIEGFGGKTLRNIIERIEV